MDRMQESDMPNSKEDCGCNDNNDCNNKENDSATQVSINVARETLISRLSESKGAVAKQESRFDGEFELFKEKQCVFLNTENNYRLYRNFDICTGTELLQTNESVKANVTQLKEWNKSLNSTLTNLFKQVKELKTKYADLKDASCKLESSYNDKCNNGQRKAITGKSGESNDEKNCLGEQCKDASLQIKQLICIPKGLALDIDSIVQSSSDVIGIQLFSNIDTLDQLQKDLSVKSVSFEKFINDTMKTRKAELDKLQEDLVTSVKSMTQAAMDRNSQRAVFEGNYDATDFLCCPACSCISDKNTNEENSDRSSDNNCKDNCKPRLCECEEKICLICKQVKNTFCCEDKNTVTTLK